ncbi:MAG: SGNH/GDSL hydrolase family protein [Candidatus Promineifilaceae bacterium]
MSSESKARVIAAEPAPRGPRSPLWAGLLISAVTVLVMLGGLELIGRVWERNLAESELGWSLVAPRRLEFQLRGSPDQPYYVLRPGGDYLWEGIPVHVNPAGLRGEAIASAKAAGAYRILNLGDSVAFGWEVRHEESYGQRLAALLSEPAGAGGVEVINAAVPTWNLEMARNYLLNEGLAFEPDAVVLDVTVVNDFRGEPAPLQGRPGLINWLRDNTHAWPFLTTNVRQLAAGESGPRAFEELTPPERAGAYFPLELDSPLWDSTWAFIADMRAALEQQAIPLVVIMFPTAFQANAAGHPDTPQQAFAGRAAAEDIAFVDLLPVYKAQCEAAGPAACEGDENHLFADVWMHPNRLGHQLAAEALAPVVAARRADGEGLKEQ